MSCVSRMKWSSAFLVVLLGATSLGAEPRSLMEDVTVHGFVSQGFILTTENNFLAEESKNGSFEFAEVGINFTKAVSENMRIGFQFFARDVGVTGNYDAKFDWFYLSYQWSDLLGIRVGRIKLPFGLYNEVVDTDSARIPILMPQALYPIQNRDFLLAQTGLELYGYTDLGSAGSLAYRLYGGTLFIERNDSPSSPLQTERINTPHVAGARLIWETPVEGLRFGGSLLDLKLDADGFIDSPPGDPLITLNLQIEAVLWVASVEYIKENWSFATEYSQWYQQLKSSNQSLIADNAVTNERMYAMLGYRLNRRWQKSVYYSVIYRDMDERAGRENKQHDWAATLRYDINENWLIKLEGHYMRGTADLSPALNGGKTRSEMNEDWGLFLLKTTAYF